MSKEYTIAVVGATGAVGAMMLECLAERQFPVGKLHAVASKRSEGDTILFKNKPILVENLDDFDFTGVDIALFSTGSETAAQFAPIAAKANCIVIDNSSQFRNTDDIPLIVPEVNPEALANFRNHNIIANPNCSTIQMLVAIKPIYDAVGIERINICTYQSVSGAGKKAISELVKQTAGLLNGHPAEPEFFDQQIAFNVLPKIDEFHENGYTLEEMKMVTETQKILNDAHIRVNPTAVRVPTFYGHAEAIHLELKHPLTTGDAKAILNKAPGVILCENNQDYPTPVRDATGKDAVTVGRVRQDISHPMGLALWVVADNVRKGAALNAVQIAELLIRDFGV